MHRARPTGRTGRESARQVAAVACWLMLLVPCTATAARGSEPVGQPQILPDQESKVMALAAPWTDEAEVLPGVRFSGARIDRAVVCYLVDGKRRLEACMFPPGASDVPDAVARRLLTAGVVLVLATPKRPTDAELALFTQLADNIARNAEAAGLASLWQTAAPPEMAAPAWRRAGNRLADPVPWLLLAIGWLLWASRIAIADLPGRGWPWWALVLGFSAWTRLTLSVQAPMTAWSWHRVTTIGLQLWESPSVQEVLELLDQRLLTYDDLQAIGSRTLSILTPLALMGHARKLFQDSRAAVVAALLLAASPHAIRFSASDTQFNVSMFWSSLTFFWVYAALDARGTIRRAVHALGMLPLLAMALTARPLNIVFGPLMLTALWIATSRDRRRWRLMLAAEVSLATAWAVYAFFAEQSAAIAALGDESGVLSVLRIFFSLAYNPLTFWRLTPPAWLLLIGLGAAALIRGTWPTLPGAISTRRGAWLVAWMLGYILLHGVVCAHEPLNHARYQLHSLPAMALLAGVGLLAWWRAWHEGAGWQRLTVASTTALCLLAPWLHAAAIGDVAFLTMQEHAFLRRLHPGMDANGGVPAGCTVLQVLRPAAGERFSKIERSGRLAMHGATSNHVWETVDVQSWPEQEAGGKSAVLANIASSLATPSAATMPSNRQFGRLSERGRALLADPPECLAFYEGPECALEPRSAERHPACVEILDSGQWQVVAEERHVTRTYDLAAVAHLRADGDPLELRMWRRVGPPRR
ncbi:MAG: hypothetical protein H6747_03110 [Deltaproteobacteria bacterium]|nr:hypothetical protein [Deltaproteobacteria bacterium]